MTPSVIILIWRDPQDGEPCGAEGLRRWRMYSRRPADTFYAPHGDPGQLAHLARAALGDAMKRSANVFIGWQATPPETTPAVEIEEAVRRLWPLTQICRERAKGERWVIASFNEPSSFPPASIQRAIDDFIAATFPQWKPGISFRPHAIALQHDVTAEELGIVERLKPTPDDIYASVAEDPEVVAAGKLWDRATPSTHRALVGAILGAQARAGILEADRAPLHSGEVETYLTPLLMRMGRGDEADAVALIRRDTRRLYGEHAETVLGFMLRTYRHGGTERLLALATQKVAA